MQGYDGIDHKLSVKYIYRMNFKAWLKLNENVGGRVVAYRRTVKEFGDGGGPEAFIKKILTSGFPPAVNSNHLAGGGIYLSEDLNKLLKPECYHFGDYMFKCVVDTSSFLDLSKTSEEIVRQLKNIVGNIPAEVMAKITAMKFSDSDYVGSVVSVDTHSGYNSGALKLQNLLRSYNIIPHKLKGFIVTVGIFGKILLAFDNSPISINAYSKVDSDYGNKQGEIVQWQSVNSSFSDVKHDGVVGEAQYREEPFDPRANSVGVKFLGRHLNPKQVFKFLEKGDGIERYVRYVGYSKDKIFFSDEEKRNGQVLSFPISKIEYVRAILNRGQKIEYEGERAVIANDNEHGVFFTYDNGRNGNSQSAKQIKPVT